MKSPNGKLVALSRTNRLEAMDAVINLRDIRNVIRDEQSGEDDKRLVRPFPLKYVKAVDVVNQLKGLLGEAVNTGGGGGSMNPQMMQQMMQMQQQMMQAAQAAAAAGGKRKKPAEKVHIIANVRDNEILVNAPPDKMALIEEAVAIIDKAPGQSDSRLSSVSETEVYRLTSLDPQTFLTILEELGGVTPRTRIQIDTGKRALIVSGPRSDHIIIEMLVKQLDGSSRHFHVIPLRKHDADYVAGSIRFMLGAEVEKKDNTQRRSFFFNEFGFGGGRGQQQESKDDTFRIDADLNYNRLLL
jgi:type II secretory pathway component GspD/PulD (secretin)